MRSNFIFRHWKIKSIKLFFGVKDVKQHIHELHVANVLRVVETLRISLHESQTILELSVQRRILQL